MTIVYVNSSASQAELQKTSRQVENGSYALELLSGDLRTAGFLAEFNPSDRSTPLASPNTKPDPCATDLATLNSSLPLAIQGYDNTGALSCIADLKANTDVLVIRRSSTCAVGDPGCDPQIPDGAYFQASSCSSDTELGSGVATKFFALDTDSAKFVLHKKDCTALAATYQYRVHIYFIANNDKPGDGIPTLKRAELGTTGAALSFKVVPLVEGVENLQVEYGLDTAVPTTGNPAVFTANPDTYLACAPAACVSNWRNAVAAKIYLLARSTAATPSFADSKSYTLGLKADGTSNVIAAANDAYKRHVYETVVRLHNPAGRNSP
jgi:type IV pilus assembly protein PilW